MYSSRSIPSIRPALFLLLMCGGLFLSTRPAETQEANQQATQAQAQPQPSATPSRPANLHQWGAVTLLHGLPSDRVRAIAQDPDGSMWFGTDAGLARYDGRRTQSITGEGLPNSKVQAIRFDDLGGMWIGTENGATRLFKGKFSFIRETDGKAVTAIITDQSGRALLATAQGVVLESTADADGTISTKSLTVDPIPSADADRAGPLYITSLILANGRLYIGTRSRGLMQIENGRAREVDARPRAFFVEAITRDHSGRLLFGAKAKLDSPGLFELAENRRLAAIQEPTGTIDVLVNGNSRDLWIGTDGRGALHLDEAGKLERYTFDDTAGGLRSDHVYSIFLDDEGIVWFGTDRGVCRYDPHAPRVENIGSEAESDFIRTLFRTSSGMLLAGTNRGLFYQDRNKDAWQRVESIGKNAVYSIIEQAGRLYVGASTGLYIGPAGWSDGATVEFTNPTPRPGGTDAPGSIRSVAFLNGAIYLASFGRGLERLDGNGINVIWPQASAPESLREIVSLSVDGNSLFIGTAAGDLFSFDGTSVTELNEFRRLQGAPIWSLKRDSQNRLWIGTARGLFTFKDGVLTEAAPGVDVRDIAVTGSPDQASNQQKEQIWCATAGMGLLRAFFDEHVGPVISRFDAEQGLPSQNAFAVLPSPYSDGKQVVIGTNRGLVRYDPSTATPRLWASRVIGKRIYSPEETANELRLDYPQNSLVVDVAAFASRTFPEQFQYAFLLFDADGNLIRQKLSHDVQFAVDGLKPGRYRIEARAFSKDLVPSRPIELQFMVGSAPFPWTTTLLAVLLAISLIALWWGYVQNRNIARTSTELVEANRQLAAARMDLANEAEVERRRIARDLHDQTLADLRNLMMLTDQLPSATNGNGVGPLAPAVFRGEIESISTEIRRICEDLSPSALDNVGLSAALEWALVNAVTHAPPERRFEFRIECEDDLEEKMSFAPGVRMQIYRIAQEVINNIGRHSDATSVLMYARILEDGSFSLAIEDNGRDFSPQTVTIGRGLNNIQARASMIGATAQWSKSESGTNVFELKKA